METVASAIREVIQSQQGSEIHEPTATEFFAVVSTTLSATQVDHMAEVLSILKAVLPHSNNLIVQRQSKSLSVCLQRIIKSCTTEDSKVLRLALDCLGLLLNSLETSETQWSSAHILQSVNVFLTFFDDLRPTIRKSSLEALKTLCLHHKKHNSQSFRTYLAEFCLETLRSSTRSQFKRPIAVLMLLEELLPLLPSPLVLRILELIPHICECEQPILTASLFRTMDSLFQSSDCPLSPPDKAQILSHLLASGPRTPDMQAHVFFCNTLASGIASLSSLYSNPFSSTSPSTFLSLLTPACQTLLRECESDFSQIHCAAGVALKRIISTCLSEPVLKRLLVFRVLNQTSPFADRESESVQSFLDCLRGSLNLRIQTSWPYSLDALRSLFDKLRPLNSITSLPNNLSSSPSSVLIPTGASSLLLQPLITDLASLRQALETKALSVEPVLFTAVDETLGSALRSTGSAAFLRLVPLTVPTPQPLFSSSSQSSMELDPNKEWVLPFLHTYLPTMPCLLSNFAQCILPIARSLYSKFTSLNQQPEKKGKAGKKSESDSKILVSQIALLRTEIIQLWSLFPDFCSDPVDLVQSLPRLSKSLQMAMQDPSLPELLPSLISSLTLLSRHACEDVSPLPSPEVRVLQEQSPTFLPLVLRFLEPLSVSDPKYSIGLEFLGSWGKVTPSPLLREVSKKLLQLLLTSTSTTDNSNAEESQAAAGWMATLLALLPHLEGGIVQLSYRTIRPLLSIHESVSLQKRAYAVLHSLLELHPAPISQVESFPQILSLVRDSLLTCHVSARHLRLRCILSLLSSMSSSLSSPSPAINQDGLITLSRSLVGEIVICLKDSNKKSRDASRDLLKALIRIVPSTLLFPDLLSGLMGHTPLIRSSSLASLCFFIREKKAFIKESEKSRRRRDDDSEEDSDEDEDEDEDSSDSDSEDEKDESDLPTPRASSSSHLSITSSVETAQSEFNSLISSCSELLPTLFPLLSEENPEQSKSLLSFCKSICTYLPLDILTSGPLPLILDLISNHLGSLKGKFSVKVKGILRKLLDRVGEETLKPLLSPVDQPLLSYLLRQERRADKKKKSKASVARSRMTLKERADLQEEEDGEDEDSAQDDSMSIAKSISNPKSSLSKPSDDHMALDSRLSSRPKAMLAKDSLKGFSRGPSSLRDLVDDSPALPTLVSNAPNSAEPEEEEPFVLTVGEDGKFLISKRELSAKPISTDANQKKRGREEDPEASAASQSSRKIVKAKVIRKPGEEYKAKKAGGDVWKKGMLAPHAFIPLDPKMFSKKHQSSSLQTMGLLIKNNNNRGEKSKKHLSKRK